MNHLQYIGWSHGIKRCHTQTAKFPTDKLLNITELSCLQAPCERLLCIPVHLVFSLANNYGAPKVSDLLPSSEDLEGKRVQS
jgi:hypothetical protein